MKNLKSLSIAALFLCGSIALAHANTYRYDFVPTADGDPNYPLSDFTGSYLDLDASSGAGVGYGTAIVDWHLVTPLGTLTGLNSSIFAIGMPPIVMSWNSSTITSFPSSPTLFDFFTSGTIYPELTLNTTYEIFSYYDSGISGYRSSTILGTWEAAPPSVPDASMSSGLMGLALTGLFAFRRKLNPR